MTDTPKDIWVGDRQTVATSPYPEPLVSHRYTHNPNGTLRETVECDYCNTIAKYATQDCIICRGTGRRVKP